MKRLLLIVVGLILGFLSLEVYFFLFNRQATIDTFGIAYDYRCYISGTYYWYKFKPNSNCKMKSNLQAFPDTYIQTNSMGLRNPEVSQAKPPATKRILFLGDSYTAGWGVDEGDAFPRVSQSLLQEAVSTRSADINIEVINGALTGSGPGYYYTFLREEGLALDPDVVVVGFYLYNDLSSQYFAQWQGTDPQGLPLTIDSTVTRIDSTGQLFNKVLPLKFTVPIEFLRHSHTFAYLTDLLFPVDYLTDPSEKLAYPLEACAFKRGCTLLDESKERVKKLFLGIKQLLGPDKQLLFVFIPNEIQIDRYARTKYGIFIPLLPSEREQPYIDFKNFFDEHNISYIDLRPAFREHPQTNIYFEKDDHFTPQGHVLVAKTIVPEIDKLLGQ